MPAIGTRWILAAALALAGCGTGADPALDRAVEAEIAAARELALRFGDEETSPLVEQRDAPRRVGGHAVACARRADGVRVLLFDAVALREPVAGGREAWAYAWRRAGC